LRGFLVLVLGASAGFTAEKHRCKFRPKLKNWLLNSLVVQYWDVQPDYVLSHTWDSDRQLTSELPAWLPQKGWFALQWWGVGGTMSQR